MTPREFSAASLTAKLALMGELLEVADELGDISVDRLEADALLKLAWERIVTQLVETAASINTHIGAALGQANASGGYRESFDMAARHGAISGDLADRLKPSAGLRNVLVHGYLRLDLRILADGAELVRRGYGEYVRSVAEWVKTQD